MAAQPLFDFLHNVPVRDVVELPQQLPVGKNDPAQSLAVKDAVRKSGGEGTAQFSEHFIVTAQQFVIYSVAVQPESTAIRQVLQHRGLAAA